MITSALSEQVIILALQERETKVPKWAQVTTSKFYAERFSLKVTGLRVPKRVF